MWTFLKKLKGSPHEREGEGLDKFARLGEQLAEVEAAGADRIHVDVMDGHFVPNLSMGAPIVQSLRRVTRLPLEVHLIGVAALIERL